MTHSMPITAPVKRRIRIIPGPSGVTIECHRCRRAFIRRRSMDLTRALAEMRRS